jgi:2-C-methyl-D-erythritol 4-phosphate cytidylyltransferase
MDGERAVVVVVAAGMGSRLDDGEPKALRTIGGRSMVTIGVGAALQSPMITGVVVAAPPGFDGQVRSLLSTLDASIVVVTGGATRQTSVTAALEVVPSDATIVVVHDAARPFASPRLFSVVVEAVVRGADAVVPVVPPVDTVKRVRAGLVVGTEPRDELALAQTPQASRIDVLRDALAKAAESGLDFSDDAGLLEWAGVPVHTVPGEAGNFKITTSRDLARADEILWASRG